MITAPSVSPSSQAASRLCAHVGWGPIFCALWLVGCVNEIGDEPVPELGFIASQEESPLGARSVPFRAGTEGYNCFRTPAIVKANNGDLLAFAGGRKGGCGDDTDADVVLRRSTDQGRSWKPMQVIDKGAGDATNRAGLPNPVVLEDGRVLVVYLWSRFVDGEEDRGCRRVYVKHSDDDGRTWSARRNITAQAQRPCREDDDGRWIDPPAQGEWGWTGLGPVHGIVKTKAPHAGRVLIAARHVAPDSKTYSHVIYSDDDGETWKIGGSLDLRSTESTVVELANGDIMLNARSRDEVGHRTVGISKDGGKTFEPAYVDDELPEPRGVQGSLLRYDNKILFSNPHHRADRTNGTIQVSHDNGRTWEQKFRYTPEGEFSSYSDMVRVKGDVGVLAEWGPSLDNKDKHREIRFIVVRKEDLGL
ncbi:MAG: sialidase family protein [Myxococcota bacterium]